MTPNPGSVAVRVDPATFHVGDAVVANGQHFWMTVRRVLPCGRRFVCNFGDSGKLCGVFADIELRHANGDPVGRIAFEKAVESRLRAAGLTETDRDLCAMFYAGYSVERAVAEIAGAKP